MMPSTQGVGAVQRPRDWDCPDSYIAVLREPFGGEVLGLRIGPIRMRLEGLSPEQTATLGRRFSPFVSPVDRQAHLTITLRRAGVESFLELPRPGSEEIYRLESRRDGPRLTLWSYEFAGRVDTGAREAVLALVEADGPSFDRGLENFLRVLTASFVLEEGGFLLHASGVVRRGRAYVFFGPSGSGKTTVAALSTGDSVLSDDLTLVVPRNGGYEAAGIPFGMRHHRVPETRASFPIASFNRLLKSQHVSRQPLTGARALAELCGCLPFVMQETCQVERAMEVAGRAAARVPVYRLQFRRDDTFWTVVEEG